MLNTVTIMGRLVTDPNFKISEGEEEREVSMSWYRLQWKEIIRRKEAIKDR